MNFHLKSHLFLSFFALFFIFGSIQTRSLTPSSLTSSLSPQQELQQQILSSDNIVDLAFPGCGILPEEREREESTSIPKKLPFLVKIFLDEQESSRIFEENNSLYQKRASQPQPQPEANPQPKIIGGGVLLTPEYILTTAHQFSTFNSTDLTRIKVGVADPLSPSLFHPILSLRYHRMYHQNTFLYDIALIRLAHPLKFTPGRLGAACLPEALDFEMENQEESESEESEFLVAEWNLSNSNDSSSLFISQTRGEFWFNCARNHMNFGKWNGRNGPVFPIHCVKRPLGVHKCFGNFGSILLKRGRGGRLAVVGIAQQARHNCAGQNHNRKLLERGERGGERASGGEIPAVFPITYAETERLTQWLYNAAWDMDGNNLEPGGGGMLKKF